jgi:hypothetical protein
VPFPTAGLLMGVAERYEVVCDFSGQASKTFFLYNGRNKRFMKVHGPAARHARPSLGGEGE